MLCAVISELDLINEYSLESIGTLEANAVHEMTTVFFIWLIMYAIWVNQQMACHEYVVPNSLAKVKPLS